MTEARVKIDVRLSPAALAQVDQLAEEDERTRSDMLRILLRIGLEEYQKRGRKR